MGLWNDIKQEWTWEGIKKSLRENWPTLLAVFIAGFLTQPCLKWMGKEHSILLFFVVYAVLCLLVSICVGLIIRIKERVKK